MIDWHISLVQQQTRRCSALRREHRRVWPAVLCKLCTCTWRGIARQVLVSSSMENQEAW